MSPVRTDSQTMNTWQGQGSYQESLPLQTRSGIRNTQEQEAKSWEGRATPRRISARDSHKRKPIPGQALKLQWKPCHEKKILSRENSCLFKTPIPVPTPDLTQTFICSSMGFGNVIKSISLAYKMPRPFPLLGLQP